MLGRTEGHFSAQVMGYSINNPKFCQSTRAVNNNLYILNYSTSSVFTHYEFSHFKDAFAIDSSVIRVNSVLEKVFASVHKGQAAMKLHTKFSIIMFQTLSRKKWILRR